MIITANILIGIGCLIILLCSLGFFRSKNIFLSVKLVFICNIYGLSILLIGFALQKFNAPLMVKTLILIIVNIIITIIINHLVIKKAAIAQQIIKDHANR
jgi:multisubunit Na+/H+ antiporter MnhG subunit